MTVDADTIRAQLVDALLAMNAPRPRAHAIADTAIHACNEALLTVKRITDALPGCENGTAAMIALQLLETSIPQNLAFLAAKLRDVGATSTEVMIGETLQ